AQVALHAVHHADDHDQRADANGDPADGDDTDERKQPGSSAAPHVPPSHRQLEPTHSPSGRSVGKRITSRMFGVPVRYMNSRSRPMPTPPIGGMPYSIARRSSSSTALAS